MFIEGKRMLEKSKVIEETLVEESCTCTVDNSPEVENVDNVPTGKQ